MHLPKLESCLLQDGLPPKKRWTLCSVPRLLRPNFIEVTPPRTNQTGLTTLQGVGKPHKIGAPIQGYPLFENGLRAHTHQSIEQNHRESAQMYAAFAQVARQNDYAWNAGNIAASAETIGLISEENRMICFPC